MELVRSRRTLVRWKTLLLGISGFVLFTIFYIAFYLQNEEFLNTIYDTKVEPSVESELKVTDAQIDAAARTFLDSFTSDLMVMANMGAEWTTLETLEELVGNQDSIVLPRMKEIYAKIQEDRRGVNTSMREQSGPRINVAAVACGVRRTELLTMAKTATLFSQDASLHFIIFSDESTILDVAADVLQLKWTVNALGWDFTYELHLHWFPDDEDVGWSKMYAPCATQRLFFPSLLPHIEALIYLDTDTLVLSNLTEFWLQFHENMEGKVAALAANNEPTSPGWYNTASRVPHYGERGLNAGVMLMNLTAMREFNFQKRAMTAQVLYEGKLDLADQDIINIIFHGFPEKVHQLDCSYNFNWVHCVDGTYCTPGATYCFCNATFFNGVQILHGNGGTFSREEYHPFMVDMYRRFEQFHLLGGSVTELLEGVRRNFTSRERPCGPLTADMLLHNARNYFTRINKQYNVT